MVTAVLIILGLAFGSFVNALVWRIYQQSLPKKKRLASDKDLSIATGRSMCTHCKHTLAWYDLIPVLSWLSVGGKCRYCRKQIGLQYPAVEIATAALFVISYVLWPIELIEAYQILGFVIWLVSLVCFMALIVYDIRWMLLPNRVVFPLIALGVLMTLVRAYGADNFTASVFLSVGGLAVAGGIFYIVFQISDGAWIGGGDVKLGFGLGLLLGSPVLAFLMLFGASVLGLLVALPGIVLKKSRMNSKLPFGPFLIISTIVVMLVGQRIFNWYTGAFLYL